MGLLSILDPLDIGGQGSAESTIEAAQTNADLLRTFSDQSQANLQPFLDLSNRQLPGLERAASVGGAFGDAESLRPLINRINKPIIAERTRDLSSSLGASGLTRSGFAGTAAADIREDADLSLLLQLQSMLTGRRQQVAGFGTQTGSNLATLGQQAAEDIGGIQSQGIFGAQQALAQGQQNILGLAGLGSQFIPTGGGAPATGVTFSGAAPFQGPQQITFPQ